MSDLPIFTGFLGSHVHLGVTGSIAAYKALDLLRLLRKSELTVTAVLTTGAREFVTPLSFEALGCGNVSTDMFSGDRTFEHLEPGANADVMAVVPATASAIAHLAHGLADDMFSCQALAFPGPMIVAPAMNPRMWNAPATRENWQKLKDRGMICLEPACGDVACGEEGPGKLVDVEDIYFEILRAVAPDDLRDKHVLITLGPTSEPWDAVRRWTNPSTGRMGACLATAAWLRGARVTVISGGCAMRLPSGVEVINVRTAQEMFDAVHGVWPGADIGCLTAAVADYRPEPYGQSKFKKSADGEGFSVRFVPNPDILASLGRIKRDDQQLIGFAAETDNVVENARSKLERKNLDMIAANRIGVSGSGFASTTNEVTVLLRDGRQEIWPQLPKTEVAWRIWDLLKLA